MTEPGSGSGTSTGLYWWFRYRFRNRRETQFRSGPSNTAENNLMSITRLRKAVILFRSKHNRACWCLIIYSRSNSYDRKSRIIQGLQLQNSWPLKIKEIADPAGRSQQLEPSREKYTSKQGVQSTGVRVFRVCVTGATDAREGGWKPVIYLV